MTNYAKDNIFYSGNDEERLVTNVKVNEFTSFFKPENVPESSRVNNIRQCENKDDIDEEDDREENEDITESEEEKVVLRDMLSRGILMAENLIQSHDIAVVDGQDPNLDDYNAAADFKMPDKYMRKQGWARRDPAELSLIHI